jgi:hypothetical protein
MTDLNAEEKALILELINSVSFKVDQKAIEGASKYLAIKAKLEAKEQITHPNEEANIVLDAVK